MPWTEERGYGDNVCGTSSWVSLNRPVEDGGWVDCDEALVEQPPGMRLADKRRRFSEDVTAFLLGEDAGALELARRDE